MGIGRSVGLALQLIAFSSALSLRDFYPRRLQSPTEHSLTSSLNSTLPTIDRRSDPFVYRLGDSIVTITYASEADKHGVESCLHAARLDYLRHEGVRDDPMGPTERVYSGSRWFPYSHLFLHPNRHMTWHHWSLAMDNMRFIAGPLAFGFGLFDGAGSDFEIDVAGIGQVGYDDFTD